MENTHLILQLDGLNYKRFEQQFENILNRQPKLISQPVREAVVTRANNT